MAVKVNYGKFFKNVKIKNPYGCEEFQLKILANKIYFDYQKSSGNIFEDMVLSASAWTIRQENGNGRIDIVSSFDDRRFIEIFFNNDNDDLRKKALRKIENEFILAYIAIHDENEEIRWNAFNKVWDEDFLRDIALNSCDWELRFNIALYYLKDVEILKGISRNCPDSELRNRARESAKKLGPLNCKSYG